jgi:hypothetical protein
LRLLQRCRPAHTLWKQELAGAGSGDGAGERPSLWEVAVEKLHPPRWIHHQLIRYDDYCYDDQ